jgi:hypothetical protein
MTLLVETIDVEIAAEIDVNTKTSKESFVTMTSTYEVKSLIFTCITHWIQLYVSGKLNIHLNDKNIPNLTCPFLIFS